MKITSGRIVRKMVVFALLLLAEYPFILADIKTVEDTMENFLEYVGRGKLARYPGTEKEASMGSFCRINRAPPCISIDFLYDILNPRSPIQSRSLAS